MGSRRRLLFRLLLLALALMTVLALTASQATGAKKRRAECTWGASSIQAQIVDGKIVASEPSTSGCIPPR
jgi:heme A synthase